MTLKRTLFWIVLLVYSWALGTVLAPLGLSVEGILTAIAGGVCVPLYVKFFYPR